AGPVRPEKAVDLARLDGQVDPVDGPDPTLELPGQPLDDDPVVHASTLPAGSRAASASSLAVRACLLDERLEEREVLVFLRVPQDAEREAALRVFERLDRAVLRPRGLAQAPSEAGIALVVVGFDCGA